MRTDELDYDLPAGLIATEPSAQREDARLLIVRRGDERTIEHARVGDLPAVLDAHDLLVVNRSRVVPARFAGVRVDTGGRVGGLYLRQGPEPDTWVCMLKARRFRAGSVIRLHDRAGAPSPVELTLVRPAGDDEPGAWIVSVDAGGSGDALSALDRIGLTPLPPYILAARKRLGVAPDDVRDRARYQTVYADEPGSVAAPTAGLHFSPALLDAIAARGIERREVVLHVAAGTFRPIETPTIEAHAMHAEVCSLPGATASAIQARLAGAQPGRVIAVGTTTARTLESYAALDPALPDQLSTRLLITPGYDWLWTQGLMTNFHLPRSTLLAMVAAMLPGGIDRLLGIYREAIDRGYRFYSFGDAMLILP